MRNDAPTNGGTEVMIRILMNRLRSLKSHRLRVLASFVAIAFAVIIKAAPAHAWVDPR